ncbi:TetR/AcrR family transcriptional regulator [Nonomuraea sp. NPDC050153]|uniref:TetR/AcrR family transcriptional regulator n=1 Tax=Nonomuraea sp. NPDC050153 TaxID=3364359 RepID=UPI0037BD0F1E
MGDSGLRADAELNRQRILAAARELFASEGTEVSMRQIALRAGVGEPTLRRRFPSKSALLAETFQDRVAAYADLAETALDDPDPWHGFATFVERMAGMQLADRGFAEVLTMSFPASLRFAKERRRGYEAIQRVIGRAQQAGRLRDDFVAEDLIMLLMAHAGVVAAGGDQAGRFSARLLAYLLHAARASAEAEPLPVPPSPAEAYGALLRLRRANAPGPAALRDQGRAPRRRTIGEEAH